MENLTIEKKNMNILLDLCKKEYIVYGPITSGLDSSFSEISSIEQLHLDYASTVLPPKKLFHPPSETLYSFNNKKEKIIFEETKKEEKILILGIHPCDVNAILKLDEFFLTDPTDKYYESRRKNSVIVALNCVEPSEYSFCFSMDTGPFLEKGYDILLTDIGTKYLVEIGSKIGKRIIDRLKLNKATDFDIKEKNRRYILTRKKFKKSMNIAWLPKIAQENLDNGVWADLGECGGVSGSLPCLSCGSCTFVCPTCYCYDVYDTMDLKLKNGKRIRELDSCQLLEYGEVALNGNFRRDRKDRIRHWMLCKFGAAAGRNNSSCVGCGRCIRVCPSKIDITEVAKVIRGDKK